MAVMFTTRLGRTLVNDDFSVDDIDKWTADTERPSHIRGYERGGDGTVIHVCTNHVVEWWAV